MRVIQWLLAGMAILSTAGAMLYYHYEEGQRKRAMDRSMHDVAVAYKRAHNGKATHPITGDMLDEGLSIGLSVYNDYHALLDKTKDHGIEWKFTAEGDTLRLSAPGVIVYVQGKDITAYTLKLDQIFAEEHWDWWQDELSAAGISDRTTSAQVSGQSSAQGKVSLYGSRSIHRKDGWATPAFELDFFQDKLSELHAGIRPGTGSEQPVTR
jgi:hypothetical protein